MSNDYSHYTLEQIIESGIFSPERMEEIQREIEARIEPVFLKNGKEVTSAKALMGDGVATLYPRMDHDHQWEYIRREALPLVLTPEELQRANAHCMALIQRRREEKDLANAAKLDHWDGAVFVGDTFYRDIGEAMDMCADSEDGLPAYLWTGEPHQVIPSFTVADVVENAMDAYGWEDMDVSDLHGVDELQAALDAFTKVNEGVVSYTQDRSQVVVIKPD
jgi:hypothetical protein